MARQIKPRDARQGRRGVHLLFILIVALILVVIAWLVVELFYFPDSPKDLSANPNHLAAHQSGQAYSLKS